MSTNKEKAERWFADFWNNCHDGCISELTHPDVVGHHEGGVTKHGHAGLRELQAEMLAVLPDVKLKLLEVVGEGDNVVVHWEAAVPKSDKIPAPVSFTGMTRMRFADGKIAEGWDCWNMGALQAHLMSLQPV